MTYQVQFNRRKLADAMIRYCGQAYGNTKLLQHGTGLPPTTLLRMKNHADCNHVEAILSVIIYLNLDINEYTYGWRL